MGLLGRAFHRVENLATWGHELVHAADDRCIAGGLKPGQRPDQEIAGDYYYLQAALNAVTGLADPAGQVVAGRGARLV